MFLLIAGCAQQAPAPQTPNSTASVTVENPPDSKLQNISILNYAFDPANLTVKAGTTVTWVNNDSVPHKVVPVSGSSDAIASGFGSANLSQGDTYSFTFNSAGTVDYYCQIHPMMKGRITVTQ